MRSTVKCHILESHSDEKFRALDDIFEDLIDGSLHTTWRSISSKKLDQLTDRECSHMTYMMPLNE